MQHTHTKFNRNRLLSFLLAFVLLLSGCAFRKSDDLYYSLPNGYFVSRINSKQITITWDENWENNPDSMCGVTAINSYFVKGFCHNERYIGLFGTHTQYDYATDNEIDTGIIQYYLIDSETETIYGPFDTQSEYSNLLQKLDCDNLGDWFETKDYPTKWKNHYRER